MDGETADTTNDDDTLVEHWSTAEAELVFKEFKGKGKFIYNFRGIVQWIDDGTEDPSGCILDGGLNEPIDHHASNPFNYKITLDYDKFHYSGVVASETSLYVIDVTCPGAFGTLQGPLENEFLQISKHPLPFGASHLKGKFEFLIGPGYSHWNFN